MGVCQCPEIGPKVGKDGFCQSNFSGDTSSKEAPPKSSKNKEKILFLRTWLLLRTFLARLAANFLEHACLISGSKICENGSKYTLSDRFQEVGNNPSSTHFRAGVQNCSQRRALRQPSPNINLATLRPLPSRPFGLHEQFPKDIFDKTRCER